MNRRGFTLLKCFGTNPVTGNRVGERHRWDSFGTCIWCHRHIDNIRTVPPVSRAIDSAAKPRRDILESQLAPPAAAKGDAP